MLKRIETIPRIKASTAPLLGIDIKQIPKIFASAILVKIGDAHFAITAGHVLDQRSNLDLYIGSGEKFLLLQGCSFGSTKISNSGNRDQDKIDLGIIRLSEKMIEHMQENEFLSLDDTYTLEGATTTGHYVFAGYPFSRNKNAIRNGKAEAKLFSFVADTAPLSEYQKVGLDPNISLLLRFDKKKLYNQAGQAVGPDLLGVSGGGVWFLDNVYTTTPLNPLLVAIFIEWWEKSREKKPPKRLLATKLHVALSAIWSRFPEVRPYLPKPTNAQINH